MILLRKLSLAFIGAAVFLGSTAHASTGSQQTTQTGAATSSTRTIGTVKSISGNAITLATDSGTELSIQVQDSARLLRMAPGQELKDAVPMQLHELQSGDRILVRGRTSDDGKTMTATAIVAMKKADIAQKQQKDIQDWQRRGVGGLVKSVEAESITISTMSPAGPKSVSVKVAKSTIVRRYSPDSVKFDDAKPGKLDEIKPGDQLRVRGNKNAEGTDIAADEIVSGTFRNIAGLVTAVDATKNTITVNDLTTKKPVTVRVTTESQMHTLPQTLAQRMAMRLKGTASSEGPQGSSANERPTSPQQANAQGGAPGEGGARPNGGGDLTQMLSRMPPMPFAELAKGDAVMIVTTAGSTTSDATAITLWSGVEPILTASPNGNGAASLLTPWSLGTGGMDSGSGGPQ